MRVQLLTPIGAGAVIMSSNPSARIEHIAPLAIGGSTLGIGAGAGTLMALY